MVPVEAAAVMAVQVVVPPAVDAGSSWSFYDAPAEISGISVTCVEQSEVSE